MCVCVQVEEEGEHNNSTWYQQGQVFHQHQVQVAVSCHPYPYPFLFSNFSKHFFAKSYANTSYTNDIAEVVFTTGLPSPAGLLGNI